MRYGYRLALSVATLTLFATSLAAAQEDAQPKTGMESLQAKGVLTDEDRAALKTWVDQRVQRIAATNPPKAMPAVAEIRKANDGTDEFKTAFAEALIAAVTANFKNAEAGSAAQLIAIVNTFQKPTAAPLLIEALRDERVPVRTVAAIGLRSLREKLVGAGGSAVNDAVNALGRAAQQETSPVALDLIYRAMDFTGPGRQAPDPKVLVSALLPAIEKRSEAYAAGNVQAIGADAPALQIASRLTRRLDETEKRRAVIATARILKHAVERYTAELADITKDANRMQIELRNRVELLIIAADELLAKLEEPSQKPKLTEAMQETEDIGTKKTDMKVQMNAWADLLQQAYQVDVHLDASADTSDEEG